MSKYEVTLSPEQRVWLAGVASILKLSEGETLQSLVESFVDTAIANKARLEFERMLRERAAREGRVREEEEEEEEGGVDNAQPQQP